ncbi:MAG TPA: hypothetical protein VGN37_17665 [Actinocatenispora sp.]
MTQPPDRPHHDSAEGVDPGRAQPPSGADADPPTAPTIPMDRQDDAGRRSTRRRRVGMISGGGALLLVAVVVVAAVVAGRPDRGEGTNRVADSTVTSTAPTPSRTADAKSHKPSASAKPPRAPHRSEPPPHRPPAQLGDKVDWSPFEHAYGAATEAPSGSRATHGGVTQVQASRSFGAYHGSGLASVTADARYFASASQARNKYDDLCGGSGGKKSGSTRSATAGDRACSYVSDVSDGSSGTVILYVQVLRGNVLLRVTPMAFHDGSWSGSDLATLRSTSVRCASATAAHL